MSKHNRKDSNVRFAYLRDPVNDLRVVTFAWRKKTEATLEYAFAVNRVVVKTRRS